MSDNNNDILHVEGGKPLNGTIKVRGAKNFVSKAMVAALLAPGTSVLKNVPEIRDVHVVSDLLRLHGVDVTVDGDHGVVTIDATNVQLADVADVDTLSGSSRIPILFSGPLLHRLGEALLPSACPAAIRRDHGRERRNCWKSKSEAHNGHRQAHPRQVRHCPEPANHRHSADARPARSGTHCSPMRGNEPSCIPPDRSPYGKRPW